MPVRGDAPLIEIKSRALRHVVQRAFEAFQAGLAHGASRTAPLRLVADNRYEISDCTFRNDEYQQLDWNGGRKAGNLLDENDKVQTASHDDRDRQRRQLRDPLRPDGQTNSIDWCWMTLSAKFR